MIIFVNTYDNSVEDTVIEARIEKWQYWYAPL